MIGPHGSGRRAQGTGRRLWGLSRLVASALATLTIFSFVGAPTATPAAATPGNAAQGVPTRGPAAACAWRGDNRSLFSILNPDFEELEAQVARKDGAGALKTTSEILDVIEWCRREADDGGHDAIRYLITYGGPLWPLLEGEQAVAFERRELALAEAILSPNHPSVADLLAELARTLSHPEFPFGPEEMGEAEQLLRRALEIRRLAYGEGHPIVAATLLDLYPLLLILGRAAEGQVVLRRALNALENSTTNSPGLVETLLADFVGLGDTAAAFRTAQLLRPSAAAMALVQTTARGAIRASAAAEDAKQLEQHRRELDRVKRELLATYERPSGAQRPRDIADLQQQEKTIQATIGRLEARLHAAAPSYAELAAPKSLDLKEVAGLLGSKEALVVFVPMQWHSVRLIVTRDRAVATELFANAARLEMLVRAILKGIAAEDEPARFEVAAAHALYEALLSDAAPMLAGMEHILFVPHGSLTALPMQILITRAPDPRATLRDQAWFVRDHAVSVLPSVSSLWATRTVGSDRNGTAHLPFIGFGDPVLADWTEDPSACAQRLALSRRPRSPNPAGLRLRAASQAQASVADSEWIRSQPSLPESRCELQALSAAEGNGSALYLGPQATEGRVKQMSARGELEQYRVVAFATHGLLPQDEDRVEEAGLILTPPSQPSSADDGLLTASEVAGLKLNADWVILSACNTAAGDAPGSEALSGLARAFFFAGARNVLVSHWAVDSDAAVRLTTRLMSLFETNPVMSKAEAVREAELAFLEPGEPPELAHPRFWAPFSLVGDGGVTAGELLNRIEPYLSAPK